MDHKLTPRPANLMPLLVLALLGLLILALGASAAPGDILFEEDFGSNLNDWVVDDSGGGDAGLANGSNIADSGNRALQLRWGVVAISTLNAIDTNLPAVDASVWVKRGFNGTNPGSGLSDPPEAGEDLVFEYFSSSGTWEVLETFTGGGTAGEVFTPTYTLPADARHANLLLRFRQTGGSGAGSGPGSDPGNDYWHIDTLQVLEGTPVAAPTPTNEWRLDELSWDAPGDVIDSIGGANGTAFNSTPIAGQVCNAADLSANSTTDYLRIGAAALDGATDFTLSVWGKTANSGSQAIFSGSTGSQHNELIMWFPNGTRFVPFLKGNGSGAITISSFADNNWHHLVWTRAGAQNCFYIDAVLQGCSNKSTQALSINNNGLIIGQEQDSLAGGFSISQEWEGLIDELLVFREALDATEVSAIFTNQSAGNGWDGTSRVCPVEPLVGNWRFDELNWSGAGGEVEDETVNAHNGTTFNGLSNAIATPAIAGNPGTCRYGDFDGVDDYIEIPHSDLLNGTNALTYTAWINPNNWSGIRQVMAKSVHGGGSGRAQMGIFSESGQLTGRAETASGRRQIRATLPATDTWSHVALVFAGDTLTLYVNGAVVGSTSFAATTLRTNNDPLAISKRVGTNQYFFAGLIDEVRVYQADLSAAEIADVMSETHPCPGLPVAEWRFDEESWDGSANEIEDSSGNNRDGTAINTQPSPGLVCNAADLSATGTSDYLSMDSSALSGLTDFSISVWGSTSPGGQKSLVSGSTGSQHNELIMFFPSSTRFDPYLKGSNSGGSITIPNIADGNLHHYVWTRSGAQNCIYVDASLQGCVNRSSAALSIAPGGLVLGQEQDSLGGGFVASQAWEGLIDEAVIFDAALSAAEITDIRDNHLAGLGWDGSVRDCAAGTDHFAILHSGNAVNCQAEPVTIEAHLADHTVDADYLGTVTLSTSTDHGDWTLISGGGSLVNGGGGDGSYAFVAADQGKVELALKNTFVETININVSDGLISDGTSAAILPDEDQDLAFAQSGFRFLADGAVNAIGAQVSSNSPSAPPGTQVYELEAIKTGDSGACEAALAGNVTVRMAFEAIDPATDAGQQVQINGAGILANPVGSVTAYTEVNLDFGNAADTTAPFTLNYPDAGKISLHAEYNIPLGSGDASGNFIRGSSNEFIVKPAGLCVEATEDNSDCASADGNCSGFKEAGEAFDLQVKAVIWEAAGETDAEFCDNAVTPNFELDNIAFLPNRIAPNPGSNTVLGAGSADIVANGAALVSQTSSEVGVFSITATPPAYLVTESIAASTSVNIGRFYPSHFTLSEGVVNEACNMGGYTYIGEQFGVSYRITAKNRVGVTTTNYRTDDDFVKLDGSPEQLSFGAVDLSVPTNFTARLVEQATIFDWKGDGTGDLETNLTLIRAGVSTTEGPHALDIGVEVEDTDEVKLLPAALDLDVDNDAVNDYGRITQSNQRYGRLVIENAYGPEQLPLAIQVRTEYWVGANFLLNTDDSCSTLTATPVTPPNQWGNFLFSGYSDNLAAGEVAPTYSATIAEGIGELLLHRPGDATQGPGIGNEGSVNVTIDSADWLEFDFGASGTDDDTQGVAVFGQYRGSDRVIYWRELIPVR